MPVPGFLKEQLAQAKYGSFTFKAPKLAILQRLQGPQFLADIYGPTTLNDESIREWVSTRTENTSLSAFCTWKQSIAPLGEHNKCIQGHHLVTMIIPMAEAQFLRQKYPHIPPHAAVGSISLSLCPMKGTRLRIDMMDIMQDIELDALTNQYTVVTGPGAEGYYVFVYLHDKYNCKAITCYSHLSPSGLIKMKWQQYVGLMADPEMEDIPIEADGGVLIHRLSWIDKSRQVKSLYELAEETLTWQQLRANELNSITVYDLCDPGTNPRKKPLSNPLSIPRLEGYLVWICRRQTEAVKFPADISRVLREQFTAVADNLWLGPPYGPNLQQGNFTLNERLTELLKERKVFTLFKSKEGTRS